MSWYMRQLADPEFQLKLTVALGMVALQCLVAIWAATSSRHWFWRALAVWAALMLMVPIRAWEPAWLFGLSSPLIVTLILLAKKWRPQEPLPAGLPPRQFAALHWQFSLLDLLLLMAISGLWIHTFLVMTRSFQPSNWLGWLASSVSLALLAVASFACARHPRQRLDAWLVVIAVLEISVAIWVGYPVLGGIAAVAGLAAYACAFDQRHWLAVLALACLLPLSSLAICLAGPWMRHLDPTYVVASTKFTEKFVALTIVGAQLAVAMVVLIALAKVAMAPSSARARRVIAALALALLAGGSSVWIGSNYRKLLAMTAPLSRVETYATTTNHYFRILEIAKGVQALDPAALTSVVVNGQVQDRWRSTKASPQLQAHYDELLPLLSVASSVPYDPSTDANGSYDSRKGAELQAWRCLTRSLRAESRLAIASGDPGRAADIAIAIIRIGDMLGRGGIEIDAMVSVAIRREGHSELAGVLENRSPLSREHLLTALNTMQRSLIEREDRAAVRARDAHFQEQVYGWGMRLENVLAGHDQHSISTEWHSQKYSLADVTANTLLQTHLAIRLFELDHRRLPDGLRELVPTYLPAIPHDPPAYPIRFHLTEDGFRLYSVGWNLQDDGGQFGTFWNYMNSRRAVGQSSGSPEQNLDFDLETLTREDVTP